MKEGEKESTAATREVLEETGFNISSIFSKVFFPLTPKATLKKTIELLQFLARGKLRYSFVHTCQWKQSFTQRRKKKYMCEW